MLKKILPIICLLFLCGCGYQVLNERYDEYMSRIEEKNYKIAYEEAIKKFDEGEFEVLGGTKRHPNKFKMRMINCRLFEDTKTAYIKCSNISLSKDRDRGSYLLEFKEIDKNKTEVRLYY